MSLSHHIRAMSALGTALKAEAENAATDPGHAELLHLMGDAHLRAAETLQAESTAEAQAFDAAHRCTVDHRDMHFATCPVCKAPREK